MNEFVDECRREWKRLGVPDAVANEMAADLAADLREAEAEGVSAEEVLGSGAFDPRSFAGAWAAARGVVEHPPSSSASGPLRRSRLPYAIAVFAVVAIVGAVLTVVSPPSRTVRLALAAPPILQQLRVGPPRLQIGPPRLLPRIGPLQVQVGPPRWRVIPPPREVVPPFSVTRGDRVVAVDTGGSGVDARAVGTALLILGLAGIVLSTLFWLWMGTGRQSLRSRLGDRPAGPAL